MRSKGFIIFYYIDDYVSVGVSSVTQESYATLVGLMEELGLTIGQKNLVAPSMQTVCLGVLIDFVKRTVSILVEKLEKINVTVCQWLSNRVVTKRQLQSLLGLLLYIHNCIKPARFFLNRMLECLCASHDIDGNPH